MSSVDVFSYALQLKAADRAEKIIELLDEATQEKIKVGLEALKGMPPDGIRQVWGERRQADEASIATGR